MISKEYEKTKVSVWLIHKRSIIYVEQGFVGEKSQKSKCYPSELLESFKTWATEDKWHNGTNEKDQAWLNAGQLSSRECSVHFSSARKYSGERDCLPSPPGALQLLGVADVSMMPVQSMSRTRELCQTWQAKSATLLLLVSAQLRSPGMGRYVVVPGRQQ